MEQPEADIGTVTGTGVDSSGVAVVRAEPPARRSHPWRVVFAVAGLAILAAAMYGTGIGEISHHIAALGWFAPLVFVPYGINALVDAAALGVTLPRGPGAPRISLMRLNLLRLAGEAVNDITPTAYFGGEPVKAHLMRRYGVPTSDAVAAVMVAKTALIASQIVFVVMGIVLFLLSQEDAQHPLATAVVLSVLGLAVILALVEIQRRGLVASCVRFATRLFPRSTLVTRLAAHADTIDARLVSFYGQNRRVFLVSTLLHFIGWLIGVAEVSLMLAFIGVRTSLTDAFIIESLSGTIRALSFLIPGTIGVQEVGGALICEMVGLAAAPALTLMLLKRAREFAFALLGLVVLAPGRGDRPTQ
jgi:putative membrane protein